MSAPAPREFKSPLREYVVLEQQDDGDGPFFVEAHRVKARNATNALRAAFKELAKRDERGDDVYEATLVVVPESTWRPTPVRARVEPKVTVSIGS